MERMQTFAKKDSATAEEHVSVDHQTPLPSVSHHAEDSIDSDDDHFSDGSISIIYSMPVSDGVKTEVRSPISPRLDPQEQAKIKERISHCQWTCKHRTSI